MVIACLAQATGSANGLRLQCRELAGWAGVEAGMRHHGVGRALVVALGAVVVLVAGDGQAAGDELIERLEADFEAEVARAADPQPLREAARLLAETNQSDRWGQYAEATRLLRRARAKGGIPL